MSSLSIPSEIKELCARLPDEDAREHLEAIGRFISLNLLGHRKSANEIEILDATWDGAERKYRLERV